MKKFLSLFFLVSSVSPLLGWSAYSLIPSYFKRAASDSKISVSEVPAAEISKMTKIVNKVTQAPQAAYASIKSFSASHPHVVKATLTVTALMVLDQLMKKTSKWYRENLAFHVAFGEKGLHHASQAALNQRSVTASE